MTNIKGILDSIRNIMWQDTGLNGDAQRIEQLGWMLFFKIFSDKDLELDLLHEDYESPIPTKFHWKNWAKDNEGITGDELLQFIDQELFPALRNLEITTSQSLKNQRAALIKEVFEGNNNYMKSGINLRKIINILNELDFNIAKERHAFGDIYETILKDLQSAGTSGEFYTPRAITRFITEMIDPKIGEKVLDPSCGTGGYLTAAIQNMMDQNPNASELQNIQDNIEGWEYKPLPYLLATTNLILHDIQIPKIKFRDSLDEPLTSYSRKNRVDVILANPPFGGIVANGNESNFPAKFKTKESADLFLILMIHLLKENGRAGIVLPDGSLTGDGVKQRVREELLEKCNLHTIIRLPNSVFQPYATVATNLLFFTKGEPTKEIWYYEHKLPEGQKSYSKTKPIQLSEFEPIKKWWNDREESDVCWKLDFQTRKVDAKKAASPYREKADSIADEISKIKSEIANTKRKLKSKKDDAELKAKQTKLTKQLKTKEAEHKEQTLAADNIYFAAFDLDIKNPNKVEETIEHSSKELMEMLEKSFAKSHDLLNQLKAAVK